MITMIGDGGWAMKETGEVIVPPGLPRRYQSPIMAVLIRCVGLGSERTPRLTRNAKTDALRKRAELQVAFRQLADLLNACWAWCDRHPADPRLVAREDQVLGLLTAYQAMHDALAVSRRIIFAELVAEEVAA